MGAERGGRAAKLGQRYEGLWVARQLLFVLCSEFCSVMLEGIGDDEPGIDLWVRHKDGTREAQQCKRQNRTHGKWPIAELNARGVLRHIRSQLQRDSSYRFTFVSQDRAPELSDLCERASSSYNDSKGFHTHQIKPYKNHRKSFNQLCGYLNLDPEDPHHRAEAHDLLRRTNMVLLDAGSEGRRDVTKWAESLVMGDPRTVIEVLAGFAEDNLGKELHADQIRRRLEEANLRPRDLSLDRNLPSRIDRLKEEFLESLKATLINGHLIPRAETQDLIRKLETDETRGPVVLHGRAGYGKSCVLLELAQYLEDQEVPFLPLRLDIRPPQVSATHYGEHVCALPTSPAVCLNAIAGDRLAVLILDQLDAIRWTSSHAAANWEALTEVINQALRFPNIRVLVACRTFDLNEDPQIQHWHKQSKGVTLEIGELSEEAVGVVVGELGCDIKSLSERQRWLLRSAQCLALWTELQGEETAPVSFKTSTDLMRRFWNHKRAKLEGMGVRPDDRDSVLAVLVDEMDHRCRLAVPSRCLDRYDRARKALQSLNVISITEDKVKFAHQSYFEYLLAERVASDVSAKQRSVVEWLGSEQPLLRREQLRQLLTLLRDDDPEQYIDSVKQLLSGENIRFHVKHLVVQFLGYCAQPTLQEADLVIELLGNDEWRDHALTAITGQPDWFDVLDERKLLRDWLASPNNELVERACWQMRSAAKYRGDRIATLLEPYRSFPSPWPERLASILPLDAKDDTRALFEMHLELLARGFMPDWRFSHDVRTLATNRPLWSIELVEAGLRRFEFELREQGRKERVGDYFEVAFDEVAQLEPAETWDRIFPCVESIAEAVPPAYQDSAPFVDDDFWEGHTRAMDGLESVKNGLVTAGRSLAETDPGGFARRLDAYSRSRYRVTQRILLRTLLALPHAFADCAIEWLCQDRRRFRLGPTHGRFPWGPARQIIARFAPHCSEDVYRRLEAAILAYRDQSEWRSFQTQSHYAAHGDYRRPNKFGHPQHALLSALPKDRIGDEACDMLGQLDRKFGAYPIEDQDEPRFLVSRVRSPIPREALIRLSDNQWLRIIRQHSVEKSDRMRARRGQSYTEASPRYFSEDLAEQAKRDPPRFARLALRIPGDANPSYRSAILDALGQGDPPGSREDGRPVVWAPATGVQIEAVLDHFGYSDNCEQAMSFCRLVRGGADCTWSESTITKLVRYATEHPDPAPGQFAVRIKDEDSSYRDRLEDSMINCVRGCAGEAIHALLSNHPELFAKFEGAIARLVDDPNPAVRVAGIGACLPILNTDPDIAVALFEKACGTNDDRVLACGYVNYFLTDVGRTHLDQLRPLIDRMVESFVADVAKAGAGRATAVVLEYDTMHGALARCVEGSVHQRGGVASVAAHWIKYEDMARGCAKLLPRFFNDDDEEVRREAAAVFLLDDSLQRREVADLASAYVNSAAFLADPTPLLYALKDHRGALTRFREVILDVCKQFSGPLREASRDPRLAMAGDAHLIPPLILCLYEQSEQAGDADTRRKCLDMFDMLLAAGIGQARDLLAEIDK